MRRILYLIGGMIDCVYADRFNNARFFFSEIIREILWILKTGKNLSA